MNISRRKFVKTGFVATSFAVIPLSFAKTAFAQNSDAPVSTSSDNALDLYNKSTFEPYVNSTFRVHLNSSRSVDVTLTEVEDFCAPKEQQAVANYGNECFSLRFTGSARGSFKQNTYEVEHGALGSFQLFIVPVGMRNGTGFVSYEAVINRRQS